MRLGQGGDDPAGQTAIAVLLMLGLASLGADVGLELERELELLYGRHAQDLRRYITRFGIGPADAEELAVDAFVAVYRAMQRNGVLEEPRAYLYRVASNKVRRLWRQRYSRHGGAEQVQQVEDADAQLDGPDETARVDDQLACKDALTALPLRQREAFVLRFYCGFAPDEIAAVMGIKVTAAKTHLQRARRKLRDVRQFGKEAAS